MKENIILPVSVVLALMLHSLILVAGIQQQSTMQHDPVRIAVRLAAPVKKTVKNDLAPIVASAPHQQRERKTIPKPEKVGLKRTEKKQIEPAPTHVESQPTVEEPPIVASDIDESIQISKHALEPDIQAQTILAADSRTQPASHSVDENQLRDEYLAMISQQLQQHKIYPILARRRGIKGKATLRIAIGNQGQILSYLLEQSSGHSLLDQAVREMIEKVNRFPAPPELIEGDLFQCRVPISFNLRNG